MEKEVGRVIKIKGNEAKVVLHSRSACGHCGARFACVAGVLGTIMILLRDKNSRARI
jgi:positive regulator of sigma E activity